MTEVTRFQLGFQVPEEDLFPGDLFRMNDGTVWKVNPDGSFSQLGSGGSTPVTTAWWGIFNTGPNDGVDENLSLIPNAVSEAQGGGQTSGNTSFGFNVTIGAAGGFAAYMAIANAFLAANPDLDAYFELAVSNAAGTQKLSYGLDVNVDFETLSGQDWGIPAFPAIPTFDDNYFVVEQVGEDLAAATDFSVGNPAAPGRMGMRSTAGGQLFSGLNVAVSGFADAPDLLTDDELLATLGHPSLADPKTLDHRARRGHLRRVAVRRGLPLPKRPHAKA